MDELLDQHASAVHRFARALTEDADAADELAQETFLRAWRARHELRDPGAARTWLLRTAHNAWRDELRSRDVRRRGRLRLARDAEARRDVAAPRADAAPEADDERARVRAALATLPARQREVLHLAAAEGLANRDIAAVLGLTPGNVASSLSLARAAVRRALAPDPDPDPDPDDR